MANTSGEHPALVLLSKHACSERNGICRRQRLLVVADMPWRLRKDRNLAALAVSCCSKVPAAAPDQGCLCCAVLLMPAVRTSAAKQQAVIRTGRALLSWEAAPCCR